MEIKQDTEIVLDNNLQEFLNECKKFDYKKVCINISHKDIPSSLTFPFGANGSVFTSPDIKYNGWSAIWEICDRFNFTGCGNLQQHTIPVSLGKGYFKLVKGNWKKII